MERGNARLLVEETAEGVLLKPAQVFAETRPDEVFASLPYKGRPKMPEEMDAGVLARRGAGMLAVDTNLIVRYLTGDHPKQSPCARALIDGEPAFGVTVVLEVEWVLRSNHEYRPADVARALRAFGGLPTVTIEDSAAIATALDLAEKGMDFADALHLSRAAHCDGFTSFDRRFIRAATAAGHDGVREAAAETLTK